MDLIDKINHSEDSSLTIDSEIKDFLLETAKWSKFIAIIGFIGIGLMVIAALGIMLIGNILPSFSQADGGVDPFFLSFIYLICAILYFFPILYLYRSSTGLKHGIQSNDQDSLRTGFENLKLHYKYIGIFLIITLSLYVVFFILGGVALALFR